MEKLVEQILREAIAYDVKKSYITDIWNFYKKSFLGIVLGENPEAKDFFKRNFPSIKPITQANKKIVLPEDAIEVNYYVLAPKNVKFNLVVVSNTEAKKYGFTDKIGGMTKNRELLILRTTDLDWVQLLKLDDKEIVTQLAKSISFFYTSFYHELIHIIDLTLRNALGMEYLPDPNKDAKSYYLSEREYPSQVFNLISVLKKLALKKGGKLSYSEFLNFFDETNQPFIATIKEYKPQGLNEIIAQLFDTLKNTYLKDDGTDMSAYLIKPVIRFKFKKGDLIKCIKPVKDYYGTKSLQVGEILKVKSTEKGGYFLQRPEKSAWFFSLDIENQDSFTLYKQ